MQQGIYYYFLLQKARYNSLITDTIGSMSQQQYVKNTNVPKKDSWLWEIGNNWRYSSSSKECYCPLKYDETKEISDLDLFTAMKELVAKPIQELDYVEYKSGYFVPAKTSDGKGALLWVYEKFEEEKAQKKVDMIKKFANSQPQQPEQKTLANTTTAVKSKTLSVNTGNKSFDELKEQVILRQDHIMTFTDPQWVSGGSDEARQLESKGYSYIPASLCRINTKTEDVHDIDAETGKGVVVGEQYLFLMGRIINVSVPDINYNNNDG